MRLTDTEIRDNYRALRQLGGYYRLSGGLVPAEFQRLQDRLGDAIRGHDDDPHPIHGDEIGSDEAAGILGVARSTVRRLARDLDGVSVSGRWVFARRSVQEYANARTTR